MEMEMQFSSLNYKLNMFPYNVQSTWNTIYFMPKSRLCDAKHCLRKSRTDSLYD